MSANDSTPIQVRIELEQKGGEWTPTYVVSAQGFPTGKNEARVQYPQTFNSRDDALQHAIKEFGSLIGEQVGSRASMSA